MCHDSAMQPVKDPCSLGTHSHSSKKYIKVFVHRTYALVNGQIKGDPLLLQPVSEPCGGVYQTAWGPSHEHGSFAHLFCLR